MYKLDFEKLCLYDTIETGIKVSVKLELKDSSIEFEAKIDTGATACIFQRIYGEKLGLNIEVGEPQRFSTATGEFLTYGHFVTLNVEGFKFDSMVFFAENEFFNLNVLGRSGWLDRVRIALDDYEGKLYISPKSYE